MICEKYLSSWWHMELSIHVPKCHFSVKVMGSPVKPGSDDEAEGERDSGGSWPPGKWPGTILCCLLRVFLTNPRRCPYALRFYPFSVATFREERLAFPLAGTASLGS